METIKIKLNTLQMNHDQFEIFCEPFQNAK